MVESVESFSLTAVGEEGVTCLRAVSCAVRISTQDIQLCSCVLASCTGHRYIEASAILRVIQQGANDSND